MSKNLNSIISLVLLSAVAMAGCNDETVPDQRIVDQMNAQRSAQGRKPGDPNTGPMSPQGATGKAPAPSGNARQ